MVPLDRHGDSNIDLYSGESQGSDQDRIGIHASRGERSIKGKGGTLHVHENRFRESGPERVHLFLDGNSIEAFSSQWLLIGFF